MSGIMGIPQQLIIGIPPHIIMQGVPFFISVIIIPHMSFIMSMVTPSPGIIMHFMPLSVMVQSMRQAMGTIMGMGIMLGDMPMGMLIGIGLVACILCAPKGLITKREQIITSAPERRNLLI